MHGWKAWRTVAALVFATASCLARAELTTEQIQSLPPARIEAALPNEHPAAYYSYAARLFAEGKKDESIMWFYVGQLRYRVHLIATKPADPSGDPALFASLNATVGQTINEYAGGDVHTWVAQIDKALSWDEQHPNGFTSKEKFKADYSAVRGGLEKLKADITAGADKIREERKKRGLENRS